jgi:hypothetical protein
VEERQVATVQRLAGCIKNRTEAGNGMRQRGSRSPYAKDGSRDASRLPSADANDTQPAGALRRGDGRDGIVVGDQ